MRWLSDKNAHNISDISISFMVFSAMYLTIYSRRTSERIMRLAPSSIRLKLQELATKITSILHAIYTAYGAHICLKELHNQPIDFFRYNEGAVYYANVAAGFFIGDLILCIILIEEHGPQFLIHAICALVGSVYVSLNGVGHQYFLHLLQFETSTPFLHIRSLLYEYGYGESIISKVNNLIFLLTFGYFRLYKGIPILTKMCYMLLNDRPVSTSSMLFLISASIAMSSLNIIWFTKILKGAIKVFT